MSAKKSWDITPSAPKKVVTPQPIARPAPSRRFADIEPIPGKTVRKKRPEPARTVVTAPAPTRREAVRAPAPRGPRVPLGKRRRNARKKLLIGLSVGIIALLVLFEILLWQPFLRISTVTTEGPSAPELKAFVERQLVGTRYLIVPRNSIFFLPEKEVRAAVLAAFPEVEAVSISPKGLSTLSVVASPRSGVLWWCGTLEAPVTPCYEADAHGFVFKQVAPELSAASTTALTIYAPLETPPGSTPPIGSSIAAHDRLPAIVQFVKAMRTLNADVVSIALRGDEADLYTRAGTRITYVVGREQQAVGLATSGFSTLNLNDGSLLYVDLRFDSKLYFKKRGE